MASLFQGVFSFRAIDGAARWVSWFEAIVDLQMSASGTGVASGGLLDQHFLGLLWVFGAAVWDVVVGD